MKRYVIAIDQSTSASKAYLLDERGQIVCRASYPHKQFHPRPGYVEHDASEIWQCTKRAIQDVIRDVPACELGAVGISNQRETTVFWDRATGEPLCHAVVWQDLRGETVCEELAERAQEIRRRTGLALSAYYPAAKAAHVLRNQPHVREAVERGELCIGTVDSYLIYRMTQGAVFRTDVSNASRTQLMELESRRWDSELCRWFGIPVECLPDIAMSDEGFGEISAEGLPAGIPIAAALGDSHAALFGHGCFEAGSAKATFGTGSSVMLNVGEKPLFSSHGLTASVGFGYQGRICYVLEGNITSSGDTLCWLRDEIGLIRDAEEAEALALTIPSSEGVYLVPAFTGLGAPHFDSGARAAIVGMSRGTTRAHIARAALESMAYQDAEVIAAMALDAGRGPKELSVDGGPAANAFLMQMFSDLTGCPINCAAQSEVSALGAGYMAGLATGVYRQGEALWNANRPAARYSARISAQERSERMLNWQRAVARCQTAVD